MSSTRVIVWRNMVARWERHPATRARPLIDDTRERIRRAMAQAEDGAECLELDRLLDRCDDLLREVTRA